MIIGYVGTPGSGKSYEAVKKILDNLKSGRIVFTNVEGLDGRKQQEHIKLKTGLSDGDLKKQLHHMDDATTDEFWNHLEGKDGALIVLDEVHKKFSNRDWASQKNKEFCEWASTHRHGGYDVLLITQDIEKIDKHARSLIEWTYFFRKINHFGNLVSLKYRRYSYDDDNHHGKPVAQETLTYDKSIFPCYSSYDSSNVVEVGIQKNVNILKHPVFFAVPVVLGLSIYFLSQSSLFSGDILGSKAIVERVDNINGKDKTTASASTAQRSAPVDGENQSINNEDFELVRLSSTSLFINGHEEKMYFHGRNMFTKHDSPYEIVYKLTGVYAKVPVTEKEEITKI